MKKFLAISLSLITLFLTGCSKESKFGVNEFVTRMNESFDTEFKTGDFLLSEVGGKHSLFLETDGYLYSLSLDINNKLSGVALLFTNEDDKENAIRRFCQICSVFTGNDIEAQEKIFDDCKITAEKINFADSNMVITVGRYKYTYICNEYSVTLFCDKV